MPHHHRHRLIDHVNTSSAADTGGDLHRHQLHPAAAHGSADAESCCRQASADASTKKQKDRGGALPRRRGVPASTNNNNINNNSKPAKVPPPAPSAAAPLSPNKPQQPLVCLHSALNPAVVYAVPPSALLAPLPTTSDAAAVYQLCPSCERGGGGVTSCRGGGAAATAAASGAPAGGHGGSPACPFVHADVHGVPPQRPHIACAASALDCYTRLPAGGAPFTMRLPAEYPATSCSRLVSCEPEAVLATRATRHLVPGAAAAAPKAGGCVDDEGHPIGCPHFMTQGRCDRGDRCRFVHLTLSPDNHAGLVDPSGGGKALSLFLRRRVRRHDPYAAVPIRVSDAVTVVACDDDDDNGATIEYR